VELDAVLENALVDEPDAAGTVPASDEIELATGVTGLLDEAAGALLVSEELEAPSVTAAELVREVEVDAAVAPTDVATELSEPYPAGALLAREELELATELLEKREAAEPLKVPDELEPSSVTVVGPVSGITVVMVKPADGPTDTVEELPEAKLLEESAAVEAVLEGDELEPPSVTVVGPVSGITVVMVEPADGPTDTAEELPEAEMLEASTAVEAVLESAEIEPPSVTVVGPVNGRVVVIVVPADGPTDTGAEPLEAELLEAAAADAMLESDELDPPSVTVVGPVSGMTVVIVVPADGPTDTVEELLEAAAAMAAEDMLLLPAGKVADDEGVTVPDADALTLARLLTKAIDETAPLAESETAGDEDPRTLAVEDDEATVPDADTDTDALTLAWLLSEAVDEAVPLTELVVDDED